MAIHMCDDGIQHLAQCRALQVNQYLKELDLGNLTKLMLDLNALPSLYK